MAVKKGVKKKEHENLTNANIEKVIGLLEQPKPITKKEACEILNITYNTTRLARIIEEYREERALESKRKAANRGKPATPFEVQAVIEGYLDGDTIADMAKRLFRSALFVKRIVDEAGVPEKAVSYAEPSVIPDQCISEYFDIGQIVWSAKYGCLAIVRKVYYAGSTGNMADYDCYQVYLIEPIEEVSPYFPTVEKYGGRYATCPYYDLGSMEHLKKFGVDVYKPYRPYFPKWLEGK